MPPGDRRPSGLATNKSAAFQMCGETALYLSLLPTSQVLAAFSHTRAVQICCSLFGRLGRRSLHASAGWTLLTPFSCPVNPINPLRKLPKAGKQGQLQGGYTIAELEGCGSWQVLVGLRTLAVYRCAADYAGGCLPLASWLQRWDRRAEGSSVVWLGTCAEPVV